MSNHLPSRFTIRVYGLLMHQGRILLSRENIKGGIYTKFPGGGLEFGEGPLECVVREFKEEANILVKPEGHFYTTEDYVPSAFGKEYQVLSIYHRVSTTQAEEIITHSPERDELLKNPGDQVLYWRYLDHLSESNVDLPIDKKVVKLLKAYSTNSE